MLWPGVVPQDGQKVLLAEIGIALNQEQKNCITWRPAVGAGTDSRLTPYQYTYVHKQCEHEPI